MNRTTKNEQNKTTNENSFDRLTHQKKWSKWAKILERNGIRREAQTVMMEEDCDANDSKTRFSAVSFPCLPSHSNWLKYTDPPPNQLTLFFFFPFCAHFFFLLLRTACFFRPEGNKIFSTSGTLSNHALGCCRNVRGSVAESFFPFFGCRLVCWALL